MNRRSFFQFLVAAIVAVLGFSSPSAFANARKRRKGKGKKSRRQLSLRRRRRHPAKGARTSINTLIS